jgi:hypothetical protein
VVSTEPGTGSSKLGQPVPLSNFLFEQLLAAGRAGKHAWALLPVERAGACPLGAVLAHDVILLWR